LRVDAAVAPVSWLEPGETAARRMLDNFLTQRLAGYNQRYDPNVQVCSDLSPYLHFGMIASQRVALAV
jgi:deoxyribodipyrimidine photo-lyase